MPSYDYVEIEGEIPVGAEGSTVRAHFAPGAADDVEGHTPATLTTRPGAEPRTATFRLERPREAYGGSRAPGFRLESAAGEAKTLKTHVLEVDRRPGGLVGRFVAVATTDHL
jgi:hypothetical protein